MKESWRKHSPAFKAKVALEALKAEESTAEIASGYTPPETTRSWLKATTGGQRSVSPPGAGVLRSWSTRRS